MDDSCAVCAEALEWVAYGSCGHREVCSTCVVRLRFVLNDRRCCICKVESPTVFVTKAMGDYTRVIADFSAFPLGANEGRVGEFWYHEDSQAYFDDMDHYRMIKAMCRLSCSICENSTDGKGGGEAGRRTRFRSIDQLKGHLFHQHNKLFMCSLCLEGRKVFISEQKLYTRVQLNQHISTGNSEVDGSESERGGFKGHPSCEFCKNPFYGDNELYMHMSREHYTCHICQRQHPGHYDYFRNYDDLEIHFRQEHYLCEDEACLAEKFVVFQSESELKRHNTIKHGGSMSRSKRNAALQIPTSFRYQSVQQQRQEQRRGRGRFHADAPSNQLAAAIQASMETAYMNNSVAQESSSAVAVVSGRRDTNQINDVAVSLESLNVALDSGLQSRSQTGVRQNGNTPVLEESSFPALTDRLPVPESSLGYAQALGSSSGVSKLGQESFPPLPGVSGHITQEPKPGNTFSEHIAKDRSKSKSARKAAQSRDARLPGNYGSDHSTSASSTQNRLTFQEAASSKFSSSSHSTPEANPGPSLPSSSGTSHVKTVGKARFASPNPVSNPWNLNQADKLSHSSSAPDLVERSLKNQASGSNIPTLNGNKKVQSGGQSLQPMEDVHTANKSLVEKIHAGLGMDEDKFAAFKSISGEYRQGLIGSVEYLSYVQQFGLSHLTIELARLCPDPKKQKELIDSYHVNFLYQNTRENGITATSSKEKNVSSKKKGKSVQTSETIRSKDLLADGILNTVKRLQENYRPQEEEVETLSKDGYRAAKGKLTLAGEEGTDSSSSIETHTDGGNGSASTGGGSGKQRKKTSKFQRVRLGDGSAAALFDLGRSSVSPEFTEGISSSNQAGGLPVRGVWKNGGGQKLFSATTRNTH